MIKANHKRPYVRFFDGYTTAMIKWYFRKVIIQSKFIDTGAPVLLIGNHFSWWDGFFSIYLNNKLVKRKLYIMMLEEQLKKRLFLSKAGAFSINRESRSMIESIRYAINILQDEKNLLCLFPQGKIESLYQESITFEKGWFKIIEGMKNDVQILFMVNLIDYFSFKRPGLYQYVINFEPTINDPGVVDIETAYNQYFEQCIRKQKAQS